MSAREKYRRPSLIAILLGTVIGLVSRAVNPSPEPPRAKRRAAAHPSDRADAPERAESPQPKTARMSARRLFALAQPLLRFPRPRADHLKAAISLAFELAQPRMPRSRVICLTVPCLNLPLARIPVSPALRQKGRAAASVTWAALCVRPWLLLALPLGLLLVMLLPQAGKLQPAALIEKVKPDPVYRANAVSAPVTLDPQLAVLDSDRGHIKLIYEGLTRYDYRMNSVPAAAESWSYAPGGQEIVFHLREGLTYSDGSLLNAQRFAFALLRAIDPRTRAQRTTLLDGVVGALAFRAADPAVLDDAALDALRGQVGIQAVTADGAACAGYDQPECRDLRIRLVRPDYGFHARMAAWVAFPAKEELLGAGDDWLLDLSRHTGNGPFRLERLNFDQHSLFRANPRYWGAQPGYSLEFAYIADGQKALVAYEAGSLDILPVAQGVFDQDGRDLSARARRLSGACTTAVIFDLTQAPFDDAQVRAAFAHAINREAYTRDLLAGQADPTLTWVPPDMPGYQPGEMRLNYDPAKARKLLAESGYRGAEQLPEIRVRFDATPENTQRWHWLRARWQDVLGVSIVLDAQPSAVEEISPMTMVEWCSETADPSGYLDFWRSGAEAARYHFADGALDDLLTQAAAEADPITRLGLYKAAQDRLLDLSPAVMLYNPARSYLFSPDLLPYGAPFDTLFPVDGDPAAFIPAKQRLYMPVIGRLETMGAAELPAELPQPAELSLPAEEP